jgi:hypothetical protein
MRLRLALPSGLLEQPARQEVALEVLRPRIVREVEHGVDELPEGTTLPRDLSRLCDRVFHCAHDRVSGPSCLHGQRPIPLPTSRNPRTAAINRARRPLAVMT